MGHAGTTLDLGQPRAASPNKPVGFWPVVVVVTVGLAIVLATLYVAGSISAKGPLATNLTEDRSYDQIEAQRGAAKFAVATEDRSYDQIEAQRGAAKFAVATEDRSYDQIEAQRGAAKFAVATEDRSYDQIEKHRSGAHVR
jgi:hypothetical protein